MPGTRRSTVYDFADLRLHPDGSRTTSKHSTVDTRGNWIATDAAGLGQVPKRRKIPAQEPTEGVTPEEVALEEEPLNPRQLKRQKFTEDLSFLGPPPSTPSEIPSSDLLKCIHYLSSSYYTEQGLLVNASKQYRKEKKERKLKKLESVPQSEDHLPNVDDSANDENPRKKKPTRIRDMYKMMDGSALIVIGMLVQEHIRSLANREPPVGWEEMMVETTEGGDADDQSDEEEEEEEDTQSVDQQDEEESISAESVA